MYAANITFIANRIYILQGINYDIDISELSMIHDLSPALISVSFGLFFPRSVVNLFEIWGDCIIIQKINNNK